MLESMSCLGEYETQAKMTLALDPNPDVVPHSYAKPLF